jgi:hypothetical protein
LGDNQMIFPTRALKQPNTLSNPRALRKGEARM